jgi:hypothetical protein
MDVERREQGPNQIFDPRERYARKFPYIAGLELGWQLQGCTSRAAAPFGRPTELAGSQTTPIAGAQPRLQERVLMPEAVRKLRCPSKIVVPAKAATQDKCLKPWIPACAGMTGKEPEMGGHGLVAQPGPFAVIRCDQRRGPMMDFATFVRRLRRAHHRLPRVIFRAYYAPKTSAGTTRWTLGAG